MLPIRTILHPTDSSENSRYAFQFACALARDYGTKLVVLHVYPTPVLFGDNIGPLPMEVPRDELLEMLNKIKPDDPAIAIERLLVVGEPANEIRETGRSPSLRFDRDGHAWTGRPVPPGDGQRRRRRVAQCQLSGAYRSDQTGRCP